jgi:tetratricopeptide (TPR) repeat protein
VRQRRNNLGFALNQLGRYADGEALSGQAIALDPRRANAHKNLGLSLQGQGHVVEAARAFVTATQVGPSDDRALERSTRAEAEQVGQQLIGWVSSRLIEAAELRLLVGDWRVLVGGFCATELGLGASRDLIASLLDGQVCVLH